MEGLPDVDARRSGIARRSRQRSPRSGGSTTRDGRVALVDDAVAQDLTARTRSERASAWQGPPARPVSLPAIPTAAAGRARRPRAWCQAYVGCRPAVRATQASSRPHQGVIAGADDWTAGLSSSARIPARHATQPMASGRASDIRRTDSSHSGPATGHLVPRRPPALSDQRCIRAPPDAKPTTASGTSSASRARSDPTVLQNWWLVAEARDENSVIQMDTSRGRARADTAVVSVLTRTQRGTIGVPEAVRRLRLRTSGPQRLSEPQHLTASNPPIQAFTPFWSQSGRAECATRARKWNSRPPGLRRRRRLHSSVPGPARGVDRARFQAVGGQLELARADHGSACPLRSPWLSTKIAALQSSSFRTPVFASWPYERRTPRGSCFT
jgi:hypothetical protein